jgi:hypothetical protein
MGYASYVVGNTKERVKVRRKENEKEKAKRMGVKNKD